MELFFAVLSTDKGHKETSRPFNVGLAVGLCLGILSLVTCPVIGTLWYKKSRRSKKVNAFHTCLNNKNNRKHEILPYFKLIFTWMTKNSIITENPVEIT